MGQVHLHPRNEDLTTGHRPIPPHPKFTSTPPFDANLVSHTLGHLPCVVRQTQRLTLENQDCYGEVSNTCVVAVPCPSHVPHHTHHWSRARSHLAAHSIGKSLVGPRDGNSKQHGQKECNFDYPRPSRPRRLPQAIDRDHHNDDPSPRSPKGACVKTKRTNRKTGHQILANTRLDAKTDDAPSVSPEVNKRPSNASQP